MRNSEKQELKRKYKRIGIFVLVIFVPAFLLCTILTVLSVPQWLNILITVIFLIVLFPLFSVICQKLEDRKKRRLQNKKDPFSE